jgi:hypothetical protein
VVTVLAYVFQDKAGPLSCEDAGDANDDGSLDLGDAITLLWFIFMDPDPLPPPAACGQDPTSDGLGCASFRFCS